MKMEEYLQNMKTLRSQMNDVEEQAAQVSVDEQSLTTSIQTMEIDLNQAKSEVKRFNEETERMVKEKGQICSQILERQKKIASLEADSSNLSQTLELIQQEKVSVSVKFQEKRGFYSQTMQDMSIKFQEQQNWSKMHKSNTESGELILIDGKDGEKIDESGGKSTSDIHPINDSLVRDIDSKYMALTSKLDYAKNKLGEITDSKSKTFLDNSKIEEAIEQLRRRIDDFPPELRAMETEALEEEHKALLSDKAGEAEYLQTLHHQIEQLKGISHVVKCRCGEEYKVEMEIRG